MANGSYLSLISVMSISPDIMSITDDQVVGEVDLDDDPTVQTRKRLMRWENLCETVTFLLILCIHCRDGHLISRKLVDIIKYSSTWIGLFFESIKSRWRAVDRFSSQIQSQVGISTTFTFWAFVWISLYIGLHVTASTVLLSNCYISILSVDLIRITDLPVPVHTGKSCKSKIQSIKSGIS